MKKWEKQTFIIKQFDQNGNKIDFNPLDLASLTLVIDTTNEEKGYFSNRLLNASKDAIVDYMAPSVITQNTEATVRASLGNLPEVSAEVDLEICLSGDIDGNGSVGLEDAILGLQLIVSILPAQNIHVCSDVNGDYRIGLDEVMFIFQKAANLRE